MKNLAEYIDLAATMTSASGNRMKVLEAMDKMYAMTDTDLPSGDNIKDTLSPDPRNSVNGGARMLSASDPKWKVPYTAPEMRAQADELEKLAERIWSGSGLVKRKPVHFSMALSAMLYGEIHLRCKLVSDMLLASPKNKLKLQQVQLRTPVIFEVINPKLCYTTTDETGLTTHLVKRKMTVAEARGISDKAAASLEGKKVNEEITVCEMYDVDNHAVWQDGQSDEWIMSPIENGIMPVAYADIEGSDLFALDQNVDSCQPFLYGVDKSGLWKRANLMLTAFYTVFFKIAKSPLFWSDADPNTDLTIDASTDAEIIKVGKGNRIGQLLANIFTGDYQNGLSIANQGMMESTMYKVAMGEAPGSGVSYSLGALMNSNGRQSLIPYERMMEHACSMGMTNALLLLKQAKGGKLGWKNAGDLNDFDTKTIPDDIYIEAKLKIELPVDKRANVQMAMQATQAPPGQMPLMSRDTAREQFLDIDQSTIEDKKILAEKFSDAQMQIQLQQMIIQAQQQSQGQVQGAPGGPQQLPPGIPPQGQPMPQQLPQEQAQPGLPMTGPGLPQEQQGAGLPEMGGAMPGGF